MIAYFLLFAVAGVPALFYWRSQNQLLWGMAWAFFVLFIGFRHHVGGDWLGYLLITERISQSDLLNSTADQEILYSLLTWCSARLGAGVYGANLVGAAIFCTGLFAYCAKLPDRWLALAAATPFLVVVAVMSANRQGVAIGVVLLLMSRWQNTGLIKRSVGIVVAGLFHTSALLLLTLTVVDLRISRIRKVALIVLAVGVGLWLMSRSENAWQRYTTIYVTSLRADSPGAIFHLTLNLVPGLIMLGSKRYWSRTAENWPLLRQLCWMAVALLTLAPFYTVAVGRMSLYLFPVSITFFSYLPSLVQAGPGRALAKTVLVASQAGVLLLWLHFANMSFTYLPYQNALFMPLSEWELPR